MTIITDNLANTAWTSFGGPLVWGGAALFGGSKKETSVAQAQVQNQNTKTITNTITPTNTWNINQQYDYSQNYPTTYGANSPIDSKKSMAANATATPSVNVTPSVSVTPSQKAEQTATNGTDFTTIAIIAAVGLVAYGFISKPSKQTHVSVTRKGANYAK